MTVFFFFVYLSISAIFFGVLRYIEDNAEDLDLVLEAMCWPFILLAGICIAAFAIISLPFALAYVIALYFKKRKGK